MQRSQVSSAQSAIPASSPSRWRARLDGASTLAIGLFIAVILRIVVFEPFTIPSSSMEPGLVTGDYIIVSKFAYGWSRASLPISLPLPEGRLLARAVQRGDVIVFRSPVDQGKTLIKRVVGLPGDRLQMIAGGLWLNGKALRRIIFGPGQDHDDQSRAVVTVGEVQPSGRSYETYGGAAGHDGDDTGVYEVPQGRYLVMGDNRDNSLDGRFPQSIGGVGYLPASNIIGKADFVLASWKPGASLLKPWTWFAVQPERFLHPIR